jgi:SAM-dependent methyltransferase
VADYYGESRPEMVSFVPADARRVLDVGCASGEFGALLKRQRPEVEVWGVEPVEEAAAKARGRLDRVLVGLFTADAPLPRGAFDAVIFNDSLEHFPAPEPPLALARDLLAPAGALVCSVPNVRYLDHLFHVLVEQDWRYREDGILDRTHLRFFTRRSLERTLQEAGFDVERMEGIHRRPHVGWKLKLALFAARGWLEDTLWLQYAVVARPAAHPGRGPGPA